MAIESFRAGDVGVNELYQKKIWRRATQATAIFNPKLGLWGKPGSGKPFIINNDFKKGSGRRVECRLLGKLKGDPYTGSADLTGLEGKLPMETFKFQISTMKSPPLGIDDEESDQAVPWSISDAHIDENADYWALLMEAGAHMQLAGSTFTSAIDYYRLNGFDIRAGITSTGIHPHAYTLGNPSLVPTREIFSSVSGTIAASENLTSTDVCNITLVNRLIAQAEGANPPILPCRVFGMYCYLVFVHSDCWGDLMASAGQYDNFAMAMLQGGLDPKKSVFTTSSLHPWRNCVFIQTRFNPPAQHSSTAAPIANTRKIYLVGQNGLVCGWGKGHDKSKVVLEEEAYNLGAHRMNSRMLWGGSKIYWTDADANLRDNAIVVANCYAANTGDAN
jgi:hypothetical protein